MANQQKHPRSFHVVVKPLGSACNLKCTYCYYEYKGTSGRIADELLEKFIRQYIEGNEDEPVTFNWHGGEPTLLGLDFFRNVIAVQQKYANGKRIENDFQTNGVLLDEAWCEFFKQHDFLVGLSIDGPKHLHDRFRMSSGSDSYFDQVYRAGQLLRRYGVRFTPLTVINRLNAQHPAEVYRFLTRDLGSQSVQWLPGVGHKDFEATAPGYWDPARMPVLGTPAARPGTPESVVTEWSVDPDDWGEFLCQTFAIWYREDLGKVIVNWFESSVAQWMGRPAFICALAPLCGRSLVTMEKDGSLYSCDHFVYPEYRLGNLSDEGFRLADVVYGPQQQQFGYNKQNSLPEYCRQCKYKFACNGECPKNRFLRAPDGQPGLNYLCQGNRRYFQYAEPFLRRIAARLQGSGTVDARA